MKNKTARMLFCFLMAAIVAAALVAVSFGGGLTGIFATDSQDSIYFSTGLELNLRKSFPFNDQLKQISFAISIAGGQREIIQHSYGSTTPQNGIFISSDGLMRNIDPPIEPYVEENIAGITQFAESFRAMRKQTYVMLVPTSGAILQQDLPRFATSVMVNQRRFIEEEVYSRISASAITIDAYDALMNRRDQYIYYRTENNLTALGGYYVYAAMLSRLGIGKAALSQFDISYLNENLTGDLYNESGFRAVSPDTISLFSYSASNRAPREYLVTQYQGGVGVKTYHTLFPTEAAALYGPQDVYMGGLSAVCDIQSASQNISRILVFGDKTALAYLPFLANNCERVTFVDLFYDYDELSFIKPLDYDKIVFAYGVETFMHTNIPARGVHFIEQNDLDEN